MRHASLLLVLLISAVAPFTTGCLNRCDTSLDCGDHSFCAQNRCQSECLTDEDCRNPPECAGKENCAEKGNLCNPSGRCEGGLQPTLLGPVVPLEPGLDRDLVAGWDAPPATGLMFVADKLQVGGAGIGFDIDLKCRGVGDCRDNSLYEIGNLANGDIQSGVSAGQSILLIEIVGMGARYFTIKFYVGRDTNNLAADNFATPSGANECCKFKISTESLDSNGQAVARAAALIHDGYITTVELVEESFEMVFPFGTTSLPRLDLRRMRFGTRMSGTPARLQDGLLGAAITSKSLSAADNPYCKAGRNSRCPGQLADSSLLDLLLLQGLEPDVDLDKDGIERFDFSGGRVSACYDGCGLQTCNQRGPAIPPIDPTQPHTCVGRPEFNDGHTIGLVLNAVTAKVVGITQ